MIDKYQWDDFPEEKITTDFWNNCCWSSRLAAFNSVGSSLILCIRVNIICGILCSQIHMSEMCYASNVQGILNTDIRKRLTCNIDSQYFYRTCQKRFLFPVCLWVYVYMLKESDKTWSKQGPALLKLQLKLTNKLMSVTKDFEYTTLFFRYNE